MAKILVVDDLPDNVTLLTYDLEDRGHEVVGAGSGREALAVAAADPPDAVLLDVMMPEMSGIDVCRRFKADPRLAHVPILLVTAKDQDQDVIDGLDAGADDYVSKPFNIRILAARLETALRTKRAQDALRETNAKLERSNHLLDEKSRRLAELNEAAYRFVDDVSHEVRTPLSVIKEFASIIEDGLAGKVTDEQREYLAIISSSVDELALMVRDMLDISKLEAGQLSVHRSRCSVEDLVEHVRTSLARKAQTRQVELSFDLPDRLPPLYADGPKAARVLVNLAVNAIKFAGKEGHVRVWARADDKAGVVRLGVTDDGPGIDPGKLDAMFERFEQVGMDARASAKGVGLGLNIAKELTGLNLGRLDVQSQRGKGSTFSFTVPIDEPARLLEHYLDHPEQARQKMAQVSLVVARIDEMCDEDVAAEVDELLGDVLRHSDLVLRPAPRTWLLVLERSDQESRAVMERIQACREEANRNRPTDTLPEIAFSWEGVWNTGDQRAALTERFGELIRHAEVAHA